MGWFIRCDAREIARRTYHRFATPELPTIVMLDLRARDVRRFAHLIPIGAYVTVTRDGLPVGRAVLPPAIRRGTWNREGDR